jgi:methanogenic corrinoid protein MtbC1
VTSTIGPDLVGGFLDLIRSRSPREAARFALRQIDEGHRPDEVIVGLLAAAQREVGERWQHAQWTIADEHQATAVTDAALHELAAATAPRSPERGTLAVVCAEGDWHTLPSRMAAELLRLEGWDVVFLGASVPTPDLARWVGDAVLDGLVVSCSLPTFAPGVLNIATATALLGVPVVAGGRGLGADAQRAASLGVRWAADLTMVAAAFDRDAPAVDPKELRGRIDAHTTATLHRAEIVRAAMTELYRTWPPMWALNAYQLDRTSEDLAHIIDFAATTDLVADGRLFTDFLDWLTTVLTVRSVPGEAVRIGLRALAAASADCPALAEVLRSASGNY